MTIGEFLSLFYGAARFTFYVNDKIKNLGLMYLSTAKIKGFDIEDNVVRFYVDESEENI